jgi:threonine-phosphate decarboxylase
MKSEHYLHGGDLDAASVLYHIDRDSIWDFSGNINPLGISPKAKEALITNIDLITTYPDKHYTRLKKQISHYCSVDSSHIIVGNGSTELISVTIKTLNPQKVLVIGPTYSEYEREITLLGGNCEYFELKAEDSFVLDPSQLITHLDASFDMLILCNPNNPTSTGVTKENLELILTAAKKHNIFTMIDETYIEFCDDLTIYSAVPLIAGYDNLLILRGISKFFSAPGLRFGYGLCSNQTLKLSIEHLKNPWTINSLAAFAAEVMLTDTGYMSQTHQLFVTERKRVIKELTGNRALQLFVPTANFVLLKILNPAITSHTLLEECMKEGMLIRDASSFPFLNDRYIRFCFLKPEQNDKLLTKLKSLTKTTPT